MKVLLDTCILAELQRENGSPAVLEHVGQYSDESLFISSITIGEIVKGIELLRTSAKKKRLTRWLSGLETHYSERILSVDQEAARIWGEVTASAQKKGLHVPVSDGLIASIALRDGLHLMTRNTKDFKATGVLLINPFTD